MKITILDDPIALRRVKFWQGRACDTQAEEKTAVSWHLKLFMRETQTPIIEGPVSVGFRFYFPIPKSWRKKKRANPPHEAIRQDIDNLVKFYLDCGNGILWVDDRQVIELTAQKAYDELARTEILIKPLR